MQHDGAATTLNNVRGREPVVSTESYSHLLNFKRGFTGFSFFEQAVCCHGVRAGVTNERA